MSSCVCGMKIYFSLNAEGGEKLECVSQETYDFRILGNETLIIVGYEDINISIFH